MARQATKTTETGTTAEIGMETIEAIKTATAAVLTRGDHRQMPKAGSPLIVRLHDAGGNVALALDGFAVTALPAQDLDDAGIIACADVWRHEYAPETVGKPLWILTMANLASDAEGPGVRVIEEIGGDRRRMPIDRGVQIRQRLFALNGGATPEDVVAPAP